MALVISLCQMAAVRARIRWSTQDCRAVRLANGGSSGCLPRCPEHDRVRLQPDPQVFEQIVTLVVRASGPATSSDHGSATLSYQSPRFDGFLESLERDLSCALVDIA